MRRFIAVLFCLVSAVASVAAHAQTAPLSVGARAVLEDVKALASDAMGGRAIGTPGADSAAAYIARRFQLAGLQLSAVGWFQPFTVAPDAPLATHAGAGGAVGRNVIGIVPGRDRDLRNETVVVGAHYDHLGLGGFGSLDPDSTGAVHNGADDNASGVAALIRIAGKIAADPPSRTVVFIAFSGEELGLLGSTWYVRHPVYPIDRTIAMLNLDMVGRLRSRRLLVFGAATAKEFRPLLDSLNWHAGFDLRTQGDGYSPSDQSAFYAAGLPVLHFFTDLHTDYHRTTDDWEKINTEGLVEVADFAAGAVRALADRPTPLTVVQLPHTAQAGPALGGGYGAYLGTIPDMSDNPGGVRLQGVREDSPAERAGLQANDIITGIGSRSIPDLDAMAQALRSYRPGDVVDIYLKRNGATVKVTATLGDRRD